MGPAKTVKSAPSGRDLMTAQQKKDADIANMGTKNAAKAAIGMGVEEVKVKKIDKDQIMAEANKARAIAEGGQPKTKATGKKEDLSFLDNSIKKK